MKKLASIIVTLFLGLIINSNLFAGGGNGSASGPGVAIDSKRVAQALGNVTIDRVEGQFYFSRRVEGQNSVDIVGQIEGKTDGQRVIFTNMSINDVPIIAPSDPPMDILPANEVGICRYFNLWLRCYSKGNLVGCAYFNAPTLNPGDAIILEFDATAILKFVPYYSDNPNLVLRIDNSTSNYDSINHGFWTSVSPYKVTSYTIVDPNTGAVHKSGSLDPNSSSEEQRGHAVSIVFPGGVKSVDQGYVYMPGQKMDGHVDGQPAKVYIWRPNDSLGWVDVSGLSNPSIELLEWTASGEMTRIQTVDNSFAGLEYGHKIVVVIVRGNTLSEDGSFQVNFGTNQ